MYECVCVCVRERERRGRGGGGGGGGERLAGRSKEIECILCVILYEHVYVMCKNFIHDHVHNNAKGCLQCVVLSHVLVSLLLCA